MVRMKRDYFRKYEIFHIERSNLTSTDTYRVGNQSSDFNSYKNGGLITGKNFISYTQKKQQKERTNLFTSLAGWYRNQGVPGTSNVLLVNVDTKTRISIRKLMPSSTRRWNAVVVVPGPVGVHWYLTKPSWLLLS